MTSSFCAPNNWEAAALHFDRRARPIWNVTHEPRGFNLQTANEVNLGIFS